MRFAALLLATAALNACAPESHTNSPASSGEKAGEGGSQNTTPATATPTPATPALAIEAEGLRLFDRATGAARPIAFGTARAPTLAALAFRGPPGAGTNGECGAGPLDYASWPDGLQLWFQDDEFVGWALDGRSSGAIGTAAGITPGVTRAELDAAYAVTVDQTTLGTEFAAGGLFGLLDGYGDRARITYMWAGVSCNFR